ncbi:MAG: zinc ABC transporter solute-binding protein [bacterium]|nr:zinc ABC transporter solute-binding protein [bacterium]
MTFKKIFSTFSLCACFWPFSATAHILEKPLVITSFSILKYLTEEIAGETVNVVSIVGPDADAHTFTPTPQVSQIVSKANLVIINGLGFEGWIDRLIDASGYEGPITIATKNIKPLQDELGGVDPHAWGDPKNVKRYITQITVGLSQLIPSRKDFFHARAKGLIRKIDLLIKKIEKDLENISEEKRKIVTAHDAFEYFGKRFHIKFLAPLGLSTDSDPSAKEIARLIDFIQEENIKTLFIENMTNEGLIRQLAEETGVTVDGPLYSDALSPEDGPAADYFSMIEHNWQLILKAMS